MTLSRRHVIALAVGATLAGPDGVWSAGASGRVTETSTVLRQMPLFTVWLQATGLIHQFDVLHIRLAAHPNQQPDAKSMHLELRWRTETWIREQAQADFASFRYRFKQIVGQDLLEKLLMTFAHVTGLPVLAASVHLHIIDSEIASYLAENGRFTTTASDLLMVHSETTITADEITVPSHHLTVPVSTPLADDLPHSDSVMQVIRTYFVGRTQSGGKPEFRRKDNSDHVIGFEVDGLRREVDPQSDNWEHLGGTMLLVTQNAELTLTLLLDGRYTSAGLMAKVPSAFAYRYDFETSEYAAIFQSYAQNLLLAHLAPAISRILK